MFYGKYVTVAEKRRRAEKTLKALKKKNPDIQPVILETKGRALAKTWWGKAWNANLESYADYANRIERGRSYVRHMAVLDLNILPGKIMGLVQGSGSRPYEVHITIKPISRSRQRRIQKECKGKLTRLKALLAGEFPRELEALFTQKGEGLFPSPKEIDLDCSCPDWARMCKHVAAVLYGVGARLDQDPGLFFTLRGIKMEDLISKVVDRGKKELLEKARKRSSRIISDQENLSALFGVDLDESPLTSLGKQPAPRQHSPGSPAPSSRPRVRSLGDKNDIIARYRAADQPIASAQLVKESEMPPTKVRNIIAQLHRSGLTRKTARGVYEWIP